MTPNHHEMGVGATEELSLRLSIATLARVLFKHPSNGDLRLALERKATLVHSEGEHFIDVKSQPFGGAMRLLDLNALRIIIGDFHFDSEKSRAEQDFRIFIRPVDWEAVKDFCLEHLRQPTDEILESDPSRELAEEFYESLGIRLQPDQYTYRAKGRMVENHPSATENIHARGYPTARIYRIFEAQILDSAVASALIKNSEGCSDHDLGELALQNARNGGVGRANTVLTVSLKELTDLYRTTSPEARNNPISFQNHRLDETVAAVLEDVSVPKYRRVS